MKIVILGMIMLFGPRVVRKNIRLVELHLRFSKPQVIWTTARIQWQTAILWLSWRIRILFVKFLNFKYIDFIFVLNRVTV